jgi:hypothetical protein
MGCFVLEELLLATETPPQNHAEWKKSEYFFSIVGDVAWVRFNQKLVVHDGGNEVNIKSLETRILRKIDGNWKIHTSFVIQQME